MISIDVELSIYMYGSALISVVSQDLFYTWILTNQKIERNCSDLNKIGWYLYIQLDNCLPHAFRKKHMVKNILNIWSLIIKTDIW